ncbi:MAG: CDF family Co(II)/Ni(II) efflux transporter DmeF [Desulfobacula sp.]|nr:CDF family Co(II)/Ni(II) efflux transporter DmeF [Desulfobacula sp.]MDA8133413.1 CDF family Co(II)/Ni(II) efflux transporter DmeF [Desulfobacteraceae bacterium]
MHIHTLRQWQHSHDFSAIHHRGESRTIKVLILTFITMGVEIVAGNIFGSMALLADGWHMGTHVAAFGISIFAYQYAKKNRLNPNFSFGTGKVSVLGGFASAVALAVIALVMAGESVSRLYHPQNIHFNEAIFVAVLGLAINLVSAFLLQDSHGHSSNEGHHHDHNLRAAYLHVLADALTSVLAIIALFSGKYFGLNWMDPVMGIVGALVISRWSWGLLRDTSSILLDQSMQGTDIIKIKKRLETDSDNRVADAHIWKVGPDHYAAIISIVTHYPKPPEHYKLLLKDLKQLDHITIEINPCLEPPCLQET